MIRSCGCRWRSGPEIRCSKGVTARPRWCGVMRWIPSACSAPTRFSSAATPRGAPTTPACASVAVLPMHLPMAGDKLVCLRNNRRKGLFNGGLWVVRERPKARRQIIRMRLKPDEDLGDRTIRVSVRPECFSGAIEAFEWPARKPYDEFDFGYVLTVHKAQGSQWDDLRPRTRRKMHEAAGAL